VGESPPHRKIYKPRIKTWQRTRKAIKRMRIWRA
jgi:hypothetical protein